MENRLKESKKERRENMEIAKTNKEKRNFHF